jgi:hypothetical protein
MPTRHEYRVNPPPTKVAIDEPTTDDKMAKIGTELVTAAVIIGCLVALYFNWQPPTYAASSFTFLGIGYLLEAVFWVWRLIPTVVWAPIIGGLFAISLYGQARGPRRSER